MYDEIFTELKEFIPGEYESYADKYHLNISNNDKDAINQIFEGSIKKVDVYHLVDLIDSHNISTYLEIGSYVGVSFRVINDLLNPAICYSIDPNIPHRVFKSPRNIFTKLNKKFEHKTNILNAFWLNGGEPVVNANYFNDLNLKFDLIFIDAFHEYERVESDFMEAIKVLSTNGIVLLHDVYSWPGVDKFVKNLEQNNNYHVKRSPKTNDTIDGFATVRLV